jgi:hypothetical protein
LARNNGLNNINLPENSEIWRLLIDNNKLTNIDVSHLTKLWYFSCSYNLIESIDLSNNPSLVGFNCANNKLSELNLSNNLQLLYLVCYDNSLERLDVSNGNNQNFGYFNAVNNLLSCINVDNPEWSNDLTNWEVKKEVKVTDNMVWFTPEFEEETYYGFDLDAGVIFSEDCSNNISVNYAYNGTWLPSSPVGVSTTNDRITIQSGAVSFDQDITADTVTVNPGASLSTAAGTTITANTIILESSQNSFANFLNEGTVTAAVTYKRYVADEVSLDLIASPVSGQTFSDFASNNSNLFYQEGNASRKLFGHYDNTNRKYITYYDNDTRTLALGTGYRAASLSSAEGNTLNFTGSVSDAQIEVPINSNGDAWNLIGNPYPTAIKLYDFMFNNYDKTHSQYDGVYGYNGKTEDKWEVRNLAYVFFNQNAVIAPGQGFFVKSKNTSDNIVFTPSMRTTIAASNFNVNKTDKRNNGWFTLELSDGSTKVTTKVYLIEGTTAGLDVGYDAATYKTPSKDLAIYTTLADGSSDNTFAVQSVDLDNLNMLRIPVGLNSSQGKQIQVRIAEAHLAEGVRVYFNDVTKVSSTLLNKGNYTYTTLTDLEGTGRFSITFSSDALSNSNQTLEGLQVYSQDKQIALQGYLEANTSISLYDLQGRAVSVKAAPKASQFNNINASHLPYGVYVLEVQNTKGRFTQKLILN